MLDLGRNGPFTTKTVRFESGERFVMAVDSDGVPVDWPVVYASVSLRGRGLMLSTMRKEMDAICLLLNWCAVRRISLEQRIESLNLFSLPEIEALRVAFRADRRTARKRANGDKAKDLPEVVGNGHWRNRLQACADYPSSMLVPGSSTTGRWSMGCGRPSLCIRTPPSLTGQWFRPDQSAPPMDR
jgi:hypothetical protein